MAVLRILLGYLVSVLTTYVAATGFYTQQVIAKQAEIGAVYTFDQQVETFTQNLTGLAQAYGGVLAVALLIGFLVAAVLKRILKPLAPIAYPVAGAAAVATAVWAIENLVLGGGLGAVGGARDAIGLALQSLAGALGGLVFAVVTARRDVG